MTVNSKFIKLIMFAICLSCFVFNEVSAQTIKFNCSVFKDTLTHKIIYKQADTIPEPEGGIQALSLAIARKLRAPVDFSGRIIVAFIVEANGTIDGKRVIKDESGKEEVFGKQILNLINNVKWKPALCNGKAVPFLYSLPSSLN